MTATPTARPSVDRDRRRRSAALLVRLIDDHRRVLGGSILGGIGWQLAGIVVPIVIGWTIDRGIVDGDRGAIWWGGLALVLLGAVEAGGAAIRHRMACTAFMHSAASLREALTAAALGLDGDGHDRFPPGEILARETSDTETVGGLMDSVGHTVAEAISIPVILVALLVIDPVVAGAVAVTVPLTAMVMWRYSVVWERRSAAAQNAMGAAVDAAQESVEGFKVVRGIGAEHATIDRFSIRSAELRDRSVDVGRLWLAFEPLLDSLSVLSVAAVLWVGGNRVIEGHATLGGIVTAIGFVLFLAGPVRTVAERILTVQIALASAGRIVDLLDAAPPVEDEEPDPRAGVAALSLESLGLGVASGHAGVSDLLVRGGDLSIVAGTTVVLEGATGSGKTTLLAALAGLRAPHAGSVRLGGLPLAEWPVGALRRRIIVCGPAPFLFSGSVAENLRFADRDATEDDLRRVLVATSCGFVDDLPDGMGSEISERGVTLSGGQRQRLALARTLLATPTVLIIDGGTSALDHDTEVAVIDGMRRELADASIIVVTANPTIRRTADQIVTIDDGRALISPP